MSYREPSYLPLEDEVEYLKAENKKLAGYLMSSYVFVHELIIKEVDEALHAYLGTEDV